MWKNIGLVFLSLIASLIFWLAVISTQQNIKVFEDEIPIKHFNVPETLFISSEIPPVTIRIDTTKEILKTTTQEDFQAFIDFSKAQMGTRLFPIEVKSENPKIRIVSFSPKEIEVILEEEKEKIMKIEIKTEGEVSENFIVENIQPEVSEVTIKAGETILNKITQIKAILKFNGEQDSFQKKVNLRAYDSKDSIIKDIEIIPENIEIKAELSQVTDTKIIGVKPNVTGKLEKENYYVKSITVYPNITEIRAKKHILNGVDYVQTKEIDISQIEETKTLSVKIIPPLNTEITGSKEVKVDIILEEIEKVEQVDEEIKKDEEDKNNDQ